MRDLIVRLLDRDTSARLGSHGVLEIKRHPWFQDIDWAAVYRRELQPPSLPEKEREVPKTPLTMETIFQEELRDGPVVAGWSFVGE